MEFNQNKPIYLQIADGISEKILSGDLKEGDRILSVRELGGELGVNPNTAMRSYEKLTMDGIIYNQRGIGYFVAGGAKSIALEKMRTDFLENELPQILRKMRLLELKAEDYLKP
ncbi:MAG: GntR family transcriptional regulator [Bacteroidaceae bacterium]|jgi:DNA-binding transcriptional regulator YhcF (GntR family)|nr:GntR family transcriptional regulator [Bacteroidaceae bacterium]MBR4811348.1 GntR family transcriptional regulator [Bacteroidaceae bacterium]